LSFKKYFKFIKHNILVGNNQLNSNPVVGSKSINSILKNSDNKADFLGKKKEVGTNLISTNINSNLNSFNIDAIEKLENVAMEKIKEKLELENKNYYDDNKVKILSYSNTDG